jgi:hypothetical protein
MKPKKPKQQNKDPLGRKYAPAYCEKCHEPLPFTYTWRNYLGHLGLHGLADSRFNGDIRAAQKHLRQNGLAKQDVAPWNNAWPKYKPLPPKKN